jgi:hypothetical protein
MLPSSRKPRCPAPSGKPPATGNRSDVPEAGANYRVPDNDQRATPKIPRPVCRSSTFVRRFNCATRHTQNRRQRISARVRTSDSRYFDTRQHWFQPLPHPVRRTTALVPTCNSDRSTHFSTCADWRQHLFDLPLHLIRDTTAVAPLTSAPVQAATALVQTHDSTASDARPIG